MRIKIIFSGEYPGFGAASKRISNYEKAIKLCNNEVEVIPINFYYNTLLFGFIVPFYVLIKIKKIKADIFFVYGFEWVSKLVILLYCKLKNIKIVFELNEKPYSIRNAGRRDILLKYLVPINFFFLTKLVYPFADGYIVISDTLKSFIQKYSSPKCKIQKVPILVDYDYYNNAKESNLDVEKPFILHSAAINDKKDGIYEVLESLGILKKRFGLKLHFYCTAPKILPQIKKNIDKIISNYDIKDQVHFTGKLSEEKLLSYQTQCDFVINFKMPIEQNHYNFATKLGEYLALGKIILTTKVGEVQNYLIDNVHCLYIEKFNSEAIAEKILDVMNNKNLQLIIAKNAKTLAKEEFDYKSNSKIIFDFFSSLLKT